MESSKEAQGRVEEEVRTLVRRHGAGWLQAILCRSHPTRLSRLASPLHAALVQAGKPEKPSLPPTSKEYASECKWSFSRDEGGYPLVAFDGELGDFVCPSMFRDLSDYVFGWPFSHFGEDVFVLDRSRIRGNLPPVSQAGSQREAVDRRTTRGLPVHRLRVPFGAVRPPSRACRQQLEPRSRLPSCLPGPLRCPSSTRTSTTCGRASWAPGCARWWRSPTS